MNLAPVVNLQGSSLTIPDGLPGVFQTIAIMRQLVKQYKINQDIRQAAVCAIFMTPEKDQLSEVTAIFDYVRDNIRYVRDIAGVETIATPDKTLLCRVGDCDDQSVLCAAMFESVGYITRFVVAGYHYTGHLEHVYLQVFADGSWLDCDPTEQEPIGYSPPNPVTVYIENI